MADELEMIWKEAVVADLRLYPGICLVGLLKTMIAEFDSEAVPLR
jgi:hypothetical protein